MSLVASLYERYPRLADTLVALLVVLLSYLGARLLSYLFGRALQRSAHSPGVDDRLLGAVKRPVTYLFFLLGVYAGVHRLPLAPRWIALLDALVVGTGVLAVTLASMRAYGILLGWYSTEPRLARGDALAGEFGPLLEKVGKVVIVLLALISLLQHYGVNVASLVVSLGVGSLAVGLAAQDTLSNMFAGFTIMVDRPFRVGDRIQLSTGEVGDVESIGIRATTLKTGDETVLVVPNSTLVKDRLVNQSRPTRALATRLELALAYGTDLRAVREVVQEAVRTCPHVDASREPSVQAVRFGDYAMHVQVGFWVTDYLHQGAARSEAHEAVHRALAEAGLALFHRTDGAPPRAEGSRT